MQFLSIYFPSLELRARSRRGALVNLDEEELEDTGAVSLLYRYLSISQLPLLPAKYFPVHIHNLRMANTQQYRLTCHYHPLAPPPPSSPPRPPPPPSVFTTLTVLLPTVTQFLVRPQEIRSRLWHPIPRLGPNRSFQTRRPCIPCSASALPPSPPPETQHQLLFAITTHASIHFDIVFMIERIPQSDSWVAVCWNPRICSNVILY